ncbi:putative WD repeat-containing protein-like protein [Emericellopsis cladophorae]|uniref:WD repeat-containing protein-like protein n=1 Tax=Emericellopsis cladophorae TaxID=2686198 RepID=A0A9Q0BDY2_9HYPO|nr:putative WD repeat-containing protein-like protein [Emericellopsis cladophorae]KAI6781040.1 putative WD repeat-containing protein-like protein [Emericellopsis cladophorae]
MTSMITAAQWVPRGFAAPFPTKYTFDEEEFARIAELAKLKLDDAEEDLEEAQEKEAGKKGGNDKVDSSMEVEGAKNGKQEQDKVNLDDDDLKEYNLDNYDDEDDAPGQGESMGIFGNVKNLAYYESNAEDPYITLKNEAGEDDEDEDREDLQILATDNLILSAKVEDELAHLEVYVYEDAADNLYVHHDIMLPAIPLAVEWLDMPVNKAGVEKVARGNFVAIGTMDPDIEVWDLDTIDCMYPNAILGQGGNTGEQKDKKKKKKKSKKANDEFHVDAVLSLAANRQHRNLLASASADKTVKLWDLNTTKCAKSYSYHTDKVCSLAWHSAEPTVLLSGSYDRTVVAADMRAPDAKAPRWGVESDVENVRWDPHDQNFFFVSTENGAVHYHDIRNAPSDPTATKSVWTLQAHDESVSSFDINPVIPGFMATGSSDKSVKLWNIDSTGPKLVVSRDLDVGKVFATTFAPDAEVGFRLAVAGSHGSMHVWDTSTNGSVRQTFAHRVPEQGGKKEDRLVGVEESDTDSDSDEGAENDEQEDDDDDSMSDA